MNLTNLTETARCKQCDGMLTTDTVVATLHGEILNPCPRCRDHPGIDPDVMQWRCVDWELIITTKRITGHIDNVSATGNTPCTPETAHSECGYVIVVPVIPA